MSRWLKGLDQVSNLIGKLDDRAATVAEEVSGNDDKVDVAGIGEIMSKRRLDDDVSDEEDETDFDEAPDQDVSQTLVDDGQEGMHHDGVTTKSQGSDLDKSMRNHEDKAVQPASSEAASVSGGEAMNLPQTMKQLPQPNHFTGMDLTTALEQKQSEQKNRMELAASSKDTQREVRTLRKHVVRLNTTLEQAESEIAALQEELRQAAKRMDKDKANAKEQREAVEKQKNEEIKAIHEEKERAITEQRTAFEDQMATFKRTISEIEKTKWQEANNWNKEIAQALEREQEMRTRTSVLEVSSVVGNEVYTLYRWRKLTDCCQLERTKNCIY